MFEDRVRNRHGWKLNIGRYMLTSVLMQFFTCEPEYIKVYMS